MMWKALLLVYQELDVCLPARQTPSRPASEIRKRFHHRASEHEIADAIYSFQGFPQLVSDLTSGAGIVDQKILYVDRPLNSLTRRGKAEFWPSPDDTQPELDEFARAGTFDSIFVFWPQHDFARGTSVPGSAWGLGMGASDWSNWATYAAVANASAAAWKNEARGEVWLHEWLHGVCHHFERRGHAMPERDADGGELHGYTRSSTHGWTDYYRDLMRGAVVESDVRLGIPIVAWRETRRELPT